MGIPGGCPLFLDCGTSRALGGHGLRILLILHIPSSLSAHYIAREIPPCLNHLRQA